MRRSRTTLKRPAGQDGYTLTEMLVVIGIIGLIAAALTPGLMNQMGRARVKAAQLQLETVASAVEVFRTDVGRYPTPDEGLEALVKEPGGVEGWSGPYLKNSRMLADPWGHPMIYDTQTKPPFLVKSLGQDGKPGGAGFDRDLTAPS